MYKHLLPLLVAIAWPCAALAQGQPAPLTLAGAIELVLERGPTLGAARHEAAAHDGAVRQAGAIPNPELSGLVEGRDSAARTTTIQLSQPIELGGKRGARVAAAERGRDAALAELRGARGELRAATGAAFHEALAAQEAERLARSSLEIAASALDAAARRVAAGKNSPVDEARARIAAASARIELVQAGGELANARRRLAALWGGSPNDFGPVEGRLEAIPEAAPLAHLMERLAQSPQLARARIEVERRRALSQLERARRIPDLTVSVGSKRDAQFGRSQATVGLALPLPLFDRNQGNLQEALQRTGKAADELAAAEARLAGELEQAHGHLAAARSKLAILQNEIVPGAQGAFDAARKGFEYGKFNFIDVVDAQRTLVQAQAQNVRTLAEAHRAAADIERILGEPAALDAPRP